MANISPRETALQAACGSGSAKEDYEEQQDQEHGRSARRERTFVDFVIYTRISLDRTGEGCGRLAKSRSAASWLSAWHDSYPRI